MNINPKNLLIATFVMGTAFLPFSQVNAGTVVNGTDNSILCKGSKSCTHLKAYCDAEGGTYTPADEYGKCRLPNQTQGTNTFRIPASLSTPVNVTPARTVTPNRR
ncbi:unknown [Crocosphaera subtropica ATCC 51142]|uniref:Uncharacterized protein n=1 Tax=Crocosphaera subtropica (strain ATCC 51142 / BH68) TaxID=43989 RepID=B1WQQ5_CROS5|nr:hypothetical protein [Crocosphaera subtropica]ACB53357.1 unknown [Crocosphaera subtropica ATCC 51142]